MCTVWEPVTHERSGGGSPCDGDYIDCARGTGHPGCPARKGLHPRTDPAHRWSAGSGSRERWAALAENVRVDRMYWREHGGARISPYGADRHRARCNGAGGSRRVGHHDPPILLRTLGVASVLVSVGLLLDSGRASDWDRLIVAFVVTALAATVLTAAWLGTKGIAFGDVLLTAFAVAVPAWVSPRAAGVTVLVGVLTALVIVIVRRMRLNDHSGGVAFGPALLAGWVVAMVVG